MDNQEAASTDHFAVCTQKGWLPHCHPSDSRLSRQEWVWGSWKKPCVMVKVSKNRGSTWHMSLVYNLSANLTNWQRRRSQEPARTEDRLLPARERLRSKSLEEATRTGPEETMGGAWRSLPTAGPSACLEQAELGTAKETSAKRAGLKRRRWRDVEESQMEKSLCSAGEMKD